VLWLVLLVSPSLFWRFSNVVQANFIRSLDMQLSAPFLFCFPSLRLSHFHHLLPCFPDALAHWERLISCSFLCLIAADAFPAAFHHLGPSLPLRFSFHLSSFGFASSSSCVLLKQRQPELRWARERERETLSRGKVRAKWCQFGAKGSLRAARSHNWRAKLRPTICLAPRSSQPHASQSAGVAPTRLNPLGALYEVWSITDWHPVPVCVRDEIVSIAVSLCLS